MGAQEFDEAEIEAAIQRGKSVYYSRGGATITDIEWRQLVIAILSEVYEDDYLDAHPDIRTFLVEDAEEVRWAGPYTIEVGEGAAMCKANRQENPNWVLQHAANALMLYRVLMGHEPWPEDPKAVERERMVKTLNGLYGAGTPAELAAALQQRGFTLPERPAA